jgi:hypothetical protein
MKPTDCDDLMTLRLLLRDLISPIELCSIQDQYKGMLILKRKNIITHITYSFLKRGIDYHNRVLARIVKIRSMIKKEFNLNTEGEPAFLVRVDDFPDPNIDAERFLTFHEILAEKNIPYLLGVTPFPSRAPLNPKNSDFGSIEGHELEILKQVSISKVEVAMHGVTHQTRSANRPTEIVGLNAENLESNLLRGLEELRTDGYKADVFIPPFNSLDLSSIKVLRKYFRVVCGGPESVLHVGLRLSPSFLNGVLYLPSYFPAYGRAREVLGFVQNLKTIREPVFVPLTLHWGWEVRDNFADVEKLCTVVQGRVLPWGNILQLTEPPGSSKSGN